MSFCNIICNIIWHQQRTQWMHTLGWVKYLKGSYSQYHACWCHGDMRSQGISMRGIDLICLEYCVLSCFEKKGTLLCHQYHSLTLKWRILMTYTNDKHSQQPSNQLSSWVYVVSVPLSRESMLTYFHLTWLTSINLARSWLHTDINNTDTHSSHMPQTIPQENFMCWMGFKKN